MIRHVPGDLRPLLRLLVRAGWTIARTSGGHAIWQGPGGRGTLTLPWHPGAYRRSPMRVRTARANIRAAVRRSGGEL